MDERLKFIAGLLDGEKMTRFERVTFAFGGQRFDTEAPDRVGAVRPQILPRLILRGGLFFIWKRFPTYWNY